MPVTVNVSAIIFNLRLCILQSIDTRKPSQILEISKMAILKKNNRIEKGELINKRNIGITRMNQNRLVKLEEMKDLKDEILDVSEKDG